MGPDREQSIVIEHKSELAVKEAAILAKETLEQLKITEPDTSVTTTTTTTSKGTTSVVAAEPAVGGVVMVAGETVRLATTTFGQSIQRKETNMIELVKAVNDLLSKITIYTYCKNFGQFRDKKTCTTGHYTNPVYTGSKAFLSYNTAHVINQEMEFIMLNRMNEFNTIFK